MLRTYCPHCDFPMTIAPVALGQQVQCRGCLQPYIAELPAPEVLEEVEVSAGGPPALPTRKKARQSLEANTHTKTFVGLLGSSLFTLLLIASGISYLALTVPPTKKTTRPTNQFNNFTPPPIYDGPKKIDDLLKEAPVKEKLPIPPAPLR
jgi:hypothetical protein